MTRSADYTIQGFIYQFNKTLLEVLNSNEESEVTIEGIIEDIEINTDSEITAIQCKYHESHDVFNLSTVYKPILQMMEHFKDNPSLNISYKLYAHFPSETTATIFPITKDHIDQIFESENKDLIKKIDKIKGNIDIEDFLSRFQLEFGASLDQLISQVQDALLLHGIAKDDIDILVYPNAIQIIADLSIIHDSERRKIKKRILLDKLGNIKKTAISRWTKALKTFDKIIRARKLQLKTNLDKNSRLRYLVLSETSLDNFSDCIVTFIADYIEKYHFKEVHNRTPLFCIDCSSNTFQDLRERLYRKNINVNDGLVTDRLFDKAKFFREPIRWEIGRNNHGVEFKIRLLRYDETNIGLLNEHKADDIFIFNKEVPRGLDLQDVAVEIINLNNIQEIKYIMGLSDTYE